MSKRRVNLQWRTLTNTTLARLSKSTSTVMTHVESRYLLYNAVRRTFYPCGLSLQISSVIMKEKKKNLTNPIGASFTKYLTNISQNYQGYYHKQSLKNYHSYKEHKKT